MNTLSTVRKQKAQHFTPTCKLLNRYETIWKLVGPMGDKTSEKGVDILENHGEEVARRRNKT